MMDEIEHFFVSYNKARGKKFEPFKRQGPKQAKDIVKKYAKKKSGWWK